MVVITFNENNKQLKKMVDSYLWYIQFIKIIIEKFGNVEKKKIYDDEYIKYVLNCLNFFELERLKWCHKKYLKADNIFVKVNFITQKPKGYIKNFRIVQNILLFGYEYWKKLFKKILLENLKVN